MKEPVNYGVIPLTKGQVAFVDLDIFSEISKYRWCAWRPKQRVSRWYAVRGIVVDGKQRMVYMHRQVLGLEYGDKRQADHINREHTLDNRRSNLRACTRAQNYMNQSRKGNSPFRGVMWDKTKKKWRASITANGKPKFLGRFDDPMEAAIAYDIAAYHRDPEFASFNFPEGAHIKSLRYQIFC
jgi:hypothetical protein